MTVDPRPHPDVQSAWQEQPSEELRLSVEDVRRQAGTFDRQVAWRNTREYAGALVGAAWFAIISWRSSDPLARVGAALTVAGLLYVVWQLHARGASRRPPAEFGLATGVEFLKRDLTRQRDLLRGVWRWYLIPPLPGVAMLFFANARAASGVSSSAAWLIGAAAGVVALVFGGIWWINARAANGLQARIDRLDALQKLR